MKSVLEAVRLQCLSCLLAVIFISASWSAHAASMAVVVKPSEMRAQAHGGSQIIAKLKQGQQVAILAATSEFVLVRYDGVYQGFMPSKYLEPVSQADCVEHSGADSGCAQATTRVNVRNGKGKPNRVLGTVDSGALLGVLSTDGDYARVLVRQSYVGYVSPATLKTRNGDRYAAQYETASKTNAVDAVSKSVATVIEPVSATTQVNRQAVEQVSTAEEENTSARSVVKSTGVAAAPMKRSRKSRWGVSTKQPRLTLGASVGFTHATASASSLQRKLTDAGLEANVLGFDEEDFAYEIFARIRLLPFVSARLSALDLGEFIPEMEVASSELEEVKEIAADAFPTGDFGALAGLDFHHEVGGWVFLVGVGAYYPLDDEVVFQTETEEVVTQGAGITPLYRMAVSRRLLGATTLGVDISATDRNGWLVTPMLIKLQHRF